MLPSYEPFIVEQTDAPCISTITFAKDAVDINAEGKEIGQFDNAGSNHAVYLLPDGGYKMVIYNYDNEPAVAFISNANFSSRLSDDERWQRVSLFRQKRNGKEHAFAAVAKAYPGN